MAVFPEAFFFRFRHSGDTEPVAFHLEVVSVVENDFGEKSIGRRTLNMVQAITAGFTLDWLLSEINTQALAELEAANARLRGVDDELEVASARVTTAEAALARALSERDTALAAAESAAELAGMGG